MKDVKIARRSEIQEIEIAGDWTHLRNHIEMIMTPDGGSPIRRAGYTLTVMRTGLDGKWRLSRGANLLTVKN